jgi:hypothetical protein
VNEVPVGGGSVTTLARRQSQPDSVAVYGTHVYWVNHGNGAVNDVPVGGGRVTTLASDQFNALSVAVDGTHVYWAIGSNRGSVNKVRRGGGRVITLAKTRKAGGNPDAIAVGP